MKQGGVEELKRKEERVAIENSGQLHHILAFPSDHELDHLVLNHVIYLATNVWKR